MPKKINTEIFISRSIENHGDTYNYDKTIYYSNKDKVIITCKIHGDFEQTPNKHLIGRGCNECGGSKKMTWLDFLLKANNKHNNKFIYKDQLFENGRSKIIITCPIHGDFKQLMEAHLRGDGCASCAGCKNYNEETILEKLYDIHNNRYEYNLYDFINNRSIIEITCPIHGKFNMRAANHLQGQICRKCYIKNFSLAEDFFLNKCLEKHNNYYDYSKSKYIKGDYDIIIICPKHGEFKQNARAHLRGNGCSKCRLSKGEIKIEEILISNEIRYKTQVVFNGCKYKRNLPFDFYLVDKNTCIEYDGEQHYQPIEFFGGDDNYKKQIIRDNIKNEYCIKNNIKLFRIKYNDNIDEKIIEILNEI